jgi:hypothetical protein
MKVAKTCFLICLSLLASNCRNSGFKGSAATRPGTGGNIQASDFQKAFSDALDVSKLPENFDEAQAGGPSGGVNGEEAYPLDLSCEQTLDKTIKVSPASSADYKVKADTRVLMNAKGRFCPNQTDNLTVLFVIDFSGSMGPNTPNQGNSTYQPASGNDPRVGKTCGRLQAVEAIMAKFKDTDKVKVGTVTFASNIIESHSVAPMELAAFKSGRLTNEMVKADNFCSYIAPEQAYATQEMAIKMPTVGAATNYEAALIRSYDYLKDTKGRKVIYFITDGRPTASSQADHLAAAKTAATQLKTVENLFFNAFFLQYKQSGLQEDKQGFDNLVQTAGAMDRVVKADSAAQLAVEISKDQTVSFDPSSIKASLTIDPYKPEAELKVLRFVQDPSNPKAWLFETQGFVLLGEDSQEVNHLMKVTATAKDGTSHTSQLKVLYRKK